MNDLIVGVHSIAEAILNPKRKIIKLVCSEEGRADLLKRSSVTSNHLKNIAVELVSSHAVQELGKKYFKELEFDFQRIPSQCFLLTDELQVKDAAWMYDKILEGEPLKILCLDQVSDVHNGAAILRTASFYGVDIFITPGRRSFRLTPSFFRIASGASEHVPIVQIQSLPKTIKKLNELGVQTVALSEHQETALKATYENQSLCLVLGKEDTGISHATMRVCQFQLSLTALGKTQSLNVSTAAAIAMEKCFSEK